MLSSSMETKFKTIFATQLRTIEPTEETRNEAKASLSRLRDLMPASINPADEPALLFVAGNIAVAGLVNKNDDGYDIPTALATYRKFQWQQINTEHDRKNPVGFVIHAGLSEFGTDRIITEDEARTANVPFNVSVVIALWRIINPDLCAYIEEASSPSHPDFKSLSLSFEMGFDDYYIVGLPGNSPIISEAQIKVMPEDPSFERFAMSLRAKEGEGLSPDDANLRLYRVIREGVVPLGGGIVQRPAAAVKGLVAITAKPVETPAAVEATVDEEIERAIEQARNAALACVNQIVTKITPVLKTSKTCVSPITSINSLMNFNEIIKASEAAKVALASAKPENLSEVAASIIDPITEAIKAESIRLENLRKEQEGHTAKIEEAKAQALASAEQLTKDLDVVRQELAQIKQAQAAAAAEESFQNRMQALEAEFDLDDEDRKLLVPEVKAQTEETFAAFMSKQKKLMKEKSKEFKKEKEKEMKASQDALLAKLSDKQVKASFDKGELVINEILASAANNVVSKPVDNMIVQPTQGSDLKELAKKAFEGMTFGGKK